MRKLILIPLLLIAAESKDEYQLNESQQLKFENLQLKANLLQNQYEAQTKELQNLFQALISEVCGQNKIQNCTDYEIISGKIFRKKQVPLSARPETPKPVQK